MGVKLIRKKAKRLPVMLLGNSERKCGKLAGEIGNAMGGGGPGASQPKRFNGSIVIKNNRMQEMVRYTFKDAWAVSWEGPKLDSGNSSLAFETLEIAHHGLEVSRSWRMPMGWT